MVTSPDYPPYEFYGTKDGDRQIIGFDIDIAREITQELGYGLSIQESDFNGLIPALQAKRADFVMAGMTPTEERGQNIDFSVIYYEAQDTLVTPKGSPLQRPQDLAGKRVGVQLGSVQAQRAEKITKTVAGLQIKPLNKVPELIQELKAKRLDGAIIEDTVARGIVQTNPDLSFEVLPADGPSGAAIAFPKGSPYVEPFNRVLRQLKQSGKLNQPAQQWFSKSIPPGPAGSPSP
jgi:polar amino acid transport system substrate-binding protein